MDTHSKEIYKMKLLIKMIGLWEFILFFPNALVNKTHAYEIPSWIMHSNFNCKCLLFPE